MILVVFLLFLYSVQKLNGICYKEEYLFEMFYERFFLNIKNDKFFDFVIYFNLRNFNIYFCIFFRYSFIIQVKFIESIFGRYVFYKFVIYMFQLFDVINIWSIIILIFLRFFGNIFIIGKV